MDASSPVRLAGFADVRAWLADRGSELADVQLRSDGAVSLAVGRASVLVVDAHTAPVGAWDVLVVVGPTDDLADALARLGGRRVQVLPVPCPATLLQRTLEEALVAARAHDQSRLADRLLEIGIALNAERDMRRLLELILASARSLTGADAGSIYLVEDDGHTLRFKNAHNDSVSTELHEFTLPVSEASVVGAAVLAGRSVRIADLYGDPSALGRAFTHDRSFDVRHGYQTRSMITTPMIAPDGRALGVVQLINARDDAGANGPMRTDADFEAHVVPFSEEDERLCAALAAQAAVALENARLYAEIQALFEGFVRASVHAIEQRDPTTSGHSQRVADLTVSLAQVADRVDSGRFADVRFTLEELRELQYAGLLHDFGKVGVREDVLIKARKLYDHQLELVLSRFDHMRTVLRVELLERQLARVREGLPDGDLLVEHDAALAEVDRAVALVLDVNEPTVVSQEVSSKLPDLARLRFRDGAGRLLRPIGDDELLALGVRRGSLTAEERLQIQSHVVHTYDFLVRIPWGKSLSRVPDIAGKHHEYLDGSGYPHRLGEADIPLQARMMTVSDIFDALTASDRPYKRAVPLDAALDILRAEVRAGKVDGDVLDLFIDARVWSRERMP